MSTSNKFQLFENDDSSGTGSTVVEIDPYKLYVEQSEAQRLMFEERLILEDEQGERLDVVTIAVEAGSEESEQGMFLVYQYSEDESRLLRVQSRVHRSLDTDTELRRIQQPDHTRTLRVSDAGESYRVFVLSVTGREGWRDKVEYEKCSSDLIILEGSNIVLLRKLAINGLLGQFRRQTINHDGELCECAYSVEEGEGGDVTVRRVVTSTTSQEMMTTLLSRDGHIRSHRWSSSGWRLVGGELKSWTDNDVSSVKEEQEAPSESEVEDADTDAYFEKKEELIRLMRSYLIEQPEVQDMIADFLKNLLFEKPEDVVGFADKFFSEFVGIDWTTEESDSSSGSETYISVKENKSNHTEEFNLEPYVAPDAKGSYVRSLASFLKTDILNAIIDKI